MPRKLRSEYPGAMYRVRSRGDRREKVLLGRQAFIKTLAEACQKNQWASAGVVSGSGYLRTTSDDVHLNPVRAGMLQRQLGMLPTQLPEMTQAMD